MRHVLSLSAPLSSSLASLQSVPIVSNSLRSDFHKVVFVNHQSRIYSGLYPSPVTEYILSLTKIFVAIFDLGKIPFYLNNNGSAS